MAQDQLKGPATTGEVNAGRLLAPFSFCYLHESSSFICRDAQIERGNISGHLARCNFHICIVGPETAQESDKDIIVVQTAY
jgi:hypothetical protein